MGPRSGVDTFKERRMSCFCQEVYSSHCTDCTTVCCIMTQSTICVNRLIGRHCGIIVYEGIFRPKHSLPF